MYAILLVCDVTTQLVIIRKYSEVDLVQSHSVDNTSSRKISWIVHAILPRHTHAFTESCLW